MNDIEKILTITEKKAQDAICGEREHSNLYDLGKCILLLCDTVRKLAARVEELQPR